MIKIQMFSGSYDTLAHTLRICGSVRPPESGYVVSALMNQQLSA
jgi:hypothetical protein